VLSGARKLTWSATSQGSKAESGKVQAEFGHWQPMSEGSEEKDIW